jgi:ABC-type transporter Mla subunit MlaD
MSESTLSDTDDVRAKLAHVEALASQIASNGQAIGNMGQVIGNAGQAIVGYQSKLATVQETVNAMAAGFSSLTGNIGSLTSNIERFQDTVRVGLMERMDRQQAAQTKLAEDMATLLGLMTEMGAPALLRRIRELEEEVNELKERLPILPPKPDGS